MVRIMGLIAAIVIASASVAQSQDHGAAYSALMAEVKIVGNDSELEDCTALLQARTLLLAASLLTKRHDELSDQRPTAERWLAKLNSNISASNCLGGNYENPSRGPIIQGIVVFGSGGGGGGGGETSDKLIDIPALSLAQLYMTDSARDAFLSAMPNDVAKALSNWRRENNVDYELLQIDINQRIVAPGVGATFLKLTDPQSIEIQNFARELQETPAGVRR